MKEACGNLEPILGAECFGAQDELAESLRNHGQLAPLLISGNRIIDGVKRWLAARSLGWPEIMVHRVPDVSDPENITGDVSQKATTGPMVLRLENDPKNHVPAMEGQNPLRGRAPGVDPKNSMDGTLLKGVTARAWVQRWQANRNRLWNLVETAIGFVALSGHDGEPSEESSPCPKKWVGEFCRSLHITPSPHVEVALKFVAGNSRFWPDFRENRLTLAILRDLAHHQGHFAELIAFFLKIEATIAEKRLIAGLLRQCATRGVLPELDDRKTIKDLIVDIEALVQPRRVEARKRFAAEVADLEFPARTEVECDATFEKPGVALRVTLKRHEVQRLEEIANKLQTLFQRIPEI